MKRSKFSKEQIAILLAAHAAMAPPVPVSCQYH